LSDNWDQTGRLRGSFRPSCRETQVQDAFTNALSAHEQCTRSATQRHLRIVLQRSPMPWPSISFPMARQAKTARIDGGCISHVRTTRDFPAAFLYTVRQARRVQYQELLRPGLEWKSIPTSNEAYAPTTWQETGKVLACGHFYPNLDI